MVQVTPNVMCLVDGPVTTLSAYACGLAKLIVQRPIYFSSILTFSLG